MNTDSIEKTILLHAPLSRVWQAISDHTEFGTWFGVRLDKPFRPGSTVRAVIVPTTVDADVAKVQKNYEGLSFDLTVDRMEPERLFSFHWHPGAADPAIDYSVEPSTLVVFTIEQVAEAVKLTVVESGFDSIPLGRRAKAFTDNDRGWTLMMKSIDEYLRNAPK